MADGSITYQTLRPRSDVPLFKCCGCKVPTYLADLNEEMKCSECGPADEEFEDTSWAAMRREHGTWSV